MDYTLYHAANELTIDFPWIGRWLGVLESWSVLVLAIATFALWLRSLAFARDDNQSVRQKS